MPSRRDLANAIRALSMDAVQKANSGHPGAPMGMADIAEVLWRDHLKHNPNDPKWADRDRFVLSNGHGSMLIYSLLHLTGYDLPISELKNFRQLHSKTPGHPEYGYAPGIETTTGPLGQGLANAVGMALAEKVLAAQFNRPGHDIIDHRTWAFMGDGCLMEGISHEVCSLAGTLGLGKLTAFYDDNGISIDGEVEGWFTDDTPARFEAYGWHVVRDIDGHDSDAVNAAIKAAKASDKPSLLCCKTIIGWGSPNKQGTEATHGAALGEDEVAATRKAIGWPHAPFEVPEEIYADWRANERGSAAQADWQARFNDYAKLYSAEAEQLSRRLKGDLPADFAAKADEWIADCQAMSEKVATRKASQMCLDAYGALLPELIGGSADLAGSNLTIWKGSKDIAANAANGNYIYYGVREFGMSAMMNGIALHGGFINYGATFLVFMEYARNATRMAAIMGQRSIFVYTHDSIGLGEDGPTHQPIEQMANLRGTPNMSLWRPCDMTESAIAWKAAIERADGPTALIFTRQGLPHQKRSEAQLVDAAKGGYILSDCDGTPDAIIIATGSEVQLAMEAQTALAAKSVQVRVVSMPSTDTFDKQDARYRDKVLPPAIRARVAVEAAHPDGWFKYVGLDGKVIGMTTFGESAPAAELFEHFGITVRAVVDAVIEIVG